MGALFCVGCKTHQAASAKPRSGKGHLADTKHTSRDHWDPKKSQELVFLKKPLGFGVQARGEGSRDAVVIQKDIRNVQASPIKIGSRVVAVNGKHVTESFSQAIQGLQNAEFPLTVVFNRDESGAAAQGQESSWVEVGDSVEVLRWSKWESVDIIVIDGGYLEVAFRDGSKDWICKHAVILPKDLQRRQDSEELIPTTIKPGNFLRIPHFSDEPAWAKIMLVDGGYVNVEFPDFSRLWIIPHDTGAPENNTTSLYRGLDETVPTVEQGEEASWVEVGDSVQVLRWSKWESADIIAIEGGFLEVIFRDGSEGWICKHSAVPKEMQSRALLNNEELMIPTAIKPGNYLRVPHFTDEPAWAKILLVDGGYANVEFPDSTRQWIIPHMSQDPDDRSMPMGAFVKGIEEFCTDLQLKPDEFNSLEQSVVRTPNRNMYCVRFTTKPFGFGMLRGGHLVSTVNQGIKQAKQVRIGSRVVAVNGHHVSHTSEYKQIAELIRTASLPVEIMFYHRPVEGIPFTAY